jgi:hypothetical protein
MGLMGRVVGQLVGLSVSCWTNSQDADAQGAPLAGAAAGQPTYAWTLSCSGAAPLFERDVNPLVEEICHGGLKRPARSDLVNVETQLEPPPCQPRKRALPGDLEHSYMLNELTGVGICPNTSPMPMSGRRLTLAQVQIIADCICNGAPNN